MLGGLQIETVFTEMRVCQKRNEIALPTRVGLKTEGILDM